jgi:hypothetical protein
VPAVNFLTQINNGNFKAGWYKMLRNQGEANYVEG